MTMPPPAPVPMPDRVWSSTVTGPDGAPALKIEALPVRPGERVVVEFHAADDARRHGLFLGTDGLLRVHRQESRAFTLWQDTAPPVVDVDVVETTNGRLTLYHTWDAGRGRRSQGHTSGMLVEELTPTHHRYACTDAGVEPDFGALVFSVRRGGDVAKR